MEQKRVSVTRVRARVCVRATSGRRVDRVRELGCNHVEENSLKLKKARNGKPGNSQMYRIDTRAGACLPAHRNALSTSVG